MSEPERAIGEGAVGVYRRAIETMTNWTQQISDDERADRIRIFEWHIARIEGHESAEACYREEARMIGRWFLKPPTPGVSFPNDSTWTSQIRTYMRSQSLRSSTEGSDGMKLSKEELFEIRQNTSAFRNWFTPIEEHQRDAECHFLRLAHFGDFADIDMMTDLFKRGQRVHNKLVTLRPDQTSWWLPRFSYHAMGCDREWRGDLLGGVRDAMFPDVIEWWEKFRLGHERFLPTEASLSYQPPPVAEPEEEPPPPEQPYGNFGERDEDVDLW